MAEIRFATSRDVDALCSLTDGPQMSRSELRDAIQGRNLFVRLCEMSNGRIIGYVVYEFCPRWTIAIHAVVVASSDRGRGVGTCLVGNLVSSCPKYRRFISWVRNDDPDRMKFFKGLGFVVVRVKHRQWGDDVVAMAEYKLAFHRHRPVIAELTRNRLSTKEGRNAA